MTYDNDVEDRATSGSQTPLLGRSSHQRIGNERDGNGWTFIHVLQFFGGGIYAPDETTYDPLEILLNTEDEDDRDELTIKWRDNKLSELNFVGVVVRIQCAFPLSRDPKRGILHKIRVPIFGILNSIFHFSRADI